MPTQKHTLILKVELEEFTFDKSKEEFHMAVTYEADVIKSDIIEALMEEYERRRNNAKI